LPRASSSISIFGKVTVLVVGAGSFVFDFNTYKIQADRTSTAKTKYLRN